ncbi:MAG: hypothetical protein AAFY41_12695 [Bacteroidota bacterium]
MIGEAYRSANRGKHFWTRKHPYQWSYEVQSLAAYAFCATAHRRLETHFCQQMPKSNETVDNPVPDTALPSEVVANECTWANLKSVIVSFYETELLESQKLDNAFWHIWSWP